MACPLEQWLQLVGKLKETDEAINGMKGGEEGAQKKNGRPNNF